ncbi:transcriptional regulator [Amylibacter ulvae]|uniref:Transcriptional regulator n=1 Tax=Paramylibacter ulvae TaxID=1651968 RepID=A0ABQ3CVZ9_9RHOB|nr:helix-turn-helix transcriptional regulator [Amylibacter ulvae]GHA45929.1 transcriptional regulator [Amylibacter ulvae]
MSNEKPDSTEFFNEDVATFGDRLEAARNAKGITTQALAQKLGVKKKTVKAWENDTVEPRANRIQMLAGLLNVSIIWLINGEANGTENVAQSFDRPEGVNDTLGEIASLKSTLSHALERLENLETRLRDLN